MPASVTQTVNSFGTSVSTGVAAASSPVAVAHLELCPAMVFSDCSTWPPARATRRGSGRAPTPASRSPGQPTPASRPAIRVRRIVVVVGDFWQVSTACLGRCTGMCASLVKMNRPSLAMRGSVRRLLHQGHGVAVRCRVLGGVGEVLRLAEPVGEVAQHGGVVDEVLGLVDQAAAQTWPRPGSSPAPTTSSERSGGSCRRQCESHRQAVSAAKQRCVASVGHAQLASARPTRSDDPMEITVRRARTADVRDIRRLIDVYTADRRLLSKATVALYEDVQEFWVADAWTARSSAAARCM